MDNTSLQLNKINTEAETKENKRSQWAKKAEYFLAVAGNIVGLGNVWRFPYLCYKNGGGVFLVPYLFFMITCGVPLFLMETALGQYTRKSGIISWRNICPLFKGIGYAGLMIIFYTAIMYIIILAWALFYLFHSFSKVLPWASCSNTWNTATCEEFHKSSLSTNWTKLENATSPAVEFWDRRVLNISGGIDELGSLNWEMALCLLLAWIICYFCVWKGVRSVGKVVYFTVSFIYIMLIILLVRGLTLPGAKDGIIYYLYPEPSRLADPQVWMDAGTQIFFSYAICIGNLITLSSYNKYTNDCYKDCIHLCLLNSGTSILAGFAVFSTLGFMAYEQGVSINEVAESGPGLIFIVYPYAISMMPLPQLWTFCLFLMIFLLGLDTQFTILEIIMATAKDMFAHLLQKERRLQGLLLLICISLYILELPMISEGGIYIFQIIDYYGCSGRCYLFIAIFQSICIGWIYGADCFFENIEEMIGYRPRPFIKYCWMIFTPVLCSGTFIFSLVDYIPLKYNTYVYPAWGYVLGWILSLSSVTFIPLWMLFGLFRAKGTLCERFHSLCKSRLQQSKSKIRVKMDATELYLRCEDNEKQ
ncbi:sodium- and chloride-dependent GABA transporter 2-like [Erpetoichthys calabaricus]|uniref:sodium- and chloride-dependent GABA transporter 2-like n=1 Tax=Erpetoichthys calabaricus TaxID=27687 RepID=UPI0022345975|nr:sodium- and chloride-dependent GABA transporter 2-like [Erpetoichthys calabaricus]